MRVPTPTLAVVAIALVSLALTAVRAPSVRAQPAAPAGSAPAASSAAPASQHLAMPFEKYTLGNGLEVILHEDRRTPVVAVNLWYHVGSKDEPRGRNGFAHLFEHVMFQGSKHVGEDLFFKYLERAGASDRNGTTNTDRTNYFETVPSNQLELVLWLESDRMGFLLDHVNQETFASQREVVKNERRQNYENAPYGLVRQYIHAAVYPPDHPYHLLTIGTPEDLDRASLDDVRAFFRTFYLPNNATLVIAGEIDRARTKALVEQYFGPIALGANPPERKGAMPVVLATEKRLDVEAGVELPRVYVTWPTPARFAPGDAELDGLAHVLTGGKSSRLYKRLVYDMQIAQNVSAVQSSSQLSSEFEIVATMKKGKSPAEALAVIDEELAKLRSGPPTADELERARAKLVSALIFEMERVTARANAFNEYNQDAGDPGYFDKDVARYERLRPADLQTAAAQYLPVARRVVTVVVPNASAPRAGRLVKGGAP